jgi:hypothetical protein
MNFCRVHPNKLFYLIYYSISQLELDVRFLLVSPILSGEGVVSLLFKKKNVVCHRLRKLYLQLVGFLTNAFWACPN